MIKPTVGRVVLYKPFASEMSRYTDQPFRADICHVFTDTCVNLSINNEDGKQFTKTSVMLAQDREAQSGECYWMDYQKGQAAKTEALEAKAEVTAAPSVLTDTALDAAMATRKYPRVTPDVIQAVIANERYFVDDTLTICVLTLRNGFKVIGQSACVDPRNFDESIGRTYARKNAEQQIWALEGYALAERVMADKTP